MTRQEQIQMRDLHQLVGALVEGQKASKEQGNRIERSVANLAAEHNKTRDMVLQHRTGYRLTAWLGAAALAVYGAWEALGGK